MFFLFCSTLIKKELKMNKIKNKKREFIMRKIRLFTKPIKGSEFIIF